MFGSIDSSAPLSSQSRSFKRAMKPRLPRKVTSSARINLNRFWNEMEELYNRYDARHSNAADILPPYTTDTFDHRRESAENRANEELERLRQTPREAPSASLPPSLPPKMRSAPSPRFQTVARTPLTWSAGRGRLCSVPDVQDDICSRCSSTSSSAGSSRSSSPLPTSESGLSATWNILRPAAEQPEGSVPTKLPSPPSSLLDLVTIMQKNFNQV